MAATFICVICISLMKIYMLQVKSRYNERYKSQTIPRALALCWQCEETRGLESFTASYTQSTLALTPLFWYRPTVYLKGSMGSSWMTGSAFLLLVLPQSTHKQSWCFFAVAGVGSHMVVPQSWLRLGELTACQSGDPMGSSRKVMNKTSSMVW